MKNYSQETISFINYLNKTTGIMNDYSTISLAAVGVPGNIISIIVFSRLIGRKTNMGVLYTSQCLIDLTTILTFLFTIRGSTMIFGVNLWNKYDWFCKFGYFIRRSMLMNSSWMAVITSFDRFVFIFYRNRFQFMRKKVNLVMIVIAMILINSLICMLNLFNYVSSASRVCTASFAITLSTDLIAILFRTYIPITLMVIFNFMMIRKISKNDKIKKSVTMAKRSRNENLFTIAVISSDMMFFISHFPLSIIYIVYDVYLYLDIFRQDQLIAVKSIFSLIFAINFSVIDMVFSIFVYFTFNKVFRNEFLSFLSFYRSNSRIPKKNYSLNPSQSQTT